MVRWIGAVLGVLILTGCGPFSQPDQADADRPGSALGDTPHPHVPEDVGEGCADAAVTAPHDLNAARAVARCAPGHPAPEPLAHEAQLTVALAGAAHETHAPVLLAEHYDQWAADGLDVQTVEMDDVADAYRALEEGDVDVVAGDLHAAFFDSVMADSGSRIVMGGAIPSAAGVGEVGQAGLWVRYTALEEPGDWLELQGEPVAVPGGISGAAAVPVNQLLVQGDASLNDVRVLTEDDAAAAELLLSGEVDAAWLDDPHWQDVTGHDGLGLVATRPQGPLGAVTVREQLVDPDADRDTGVALLRSLTRTVNTYLDEDYRDDAEVAEALVEATGWSEEQLHAGPHFIFDWELRADGLEPMQTELTQLGAVLYPDPVEDDRFVDTSLYLEAVGHASGWQAEGQAANQAADQPTG